MRQGWIAGVLVVGLAACSATSTPTSQPAVASPSPSVIPASGPVAAPSAVGTPAPGARDLALHPLPQLDGLLRGVAVAGLASGPSGVVILGNDRRTGALLALTSADGDDWNRHWLPGTTFGGGTPDRLIGGSFGFLALGWSPRPGSAARALWSSQDGTTWSLSGATGFPAGEVTALTATPWGAAASLDVGGAGALVATTTDGSTWSVAPIPEAPLANVYSLIPLPDGLLVTGMSMADQDAATNAFRAWRSDDGRTWSVAPGLAAAIGSQENSIEVWQPSPWGAAGSGSDNREVGVVAGDGFAPLAAPPDPWGRLVGGPAGLVWLQGADAGATCSAAWRYASDTWEPLTGTNNDRSCLDEAGPSVLGSASTADGMVVVAMLGTWADRVAWLIRAPGATPSGGDGGGPVEPPADAIPDPLAAVVERPSTCPALPTTVGSVLELPPLTAVGCFADQPISFRAWVVDPGEGYGGTCSAFTPAWIRECVLADYQLAASVPGTGDQTARLHAQRAPTATGATKGVGRWVRATGHYDDPVSPTCRGVGPSGDVAFESEIPPSLAVLSCRLVFVVTDVRNAT